MPGIESVLCPVDLSTASLRAFDYAIKLALNYRARLHLLHVSIDPVVATAYDPHLDTRTLLTTIKEQAELEMRRLRKVATDAGVVADTNVRTGEVEAEIIDAAKTNKADIVVLGKHGRRGIDRWFIGSVTDHLLRRLSIPILIISEGKAKRLALPKVKRVLIATDFSEGTGDAIALGISLAKEEQVTVTLFHVVPEGPVGVDLPFQDTVETARAELQRLIRQEAHKAANVVPKIATGVPYQEILNFVRLNKQDLIVMNIHGKGAFERFLLGSNAERVIRGAPCPVLAIPPETDEAGEKDNYLRAS